MDIIKKIAAGKIWQILPTMSVNDLEVVIKLASDSYYNKAESIITDADYDILVQKLQLLSPKSALLHQTGAPITGKKVKLPYWMGSMDKIKTDEKVLTNWKKAYMGPYIISDKLDGISCLLTIDKSVVKLYTRGNGEYGQDVSHLAPLINLDLKHLVSLKKKMAIRGELIMPIKSFKKWSKIMSNPRNMVGGVVISKPTSVNKKYAADIDFVSYEIIDPVLPPSRQFATLAELGLPVVFSRSIDVIDLPSLSKILDLRKSKSKYEIDGLIVSDDNPHTRNLSGNPPYSFAYKGLSETANTEITQIDWNPSKDGYLVPRIYYRTVRLSGANLSHTSGFNAKYIVDNSLGPGAIVTIVRSGDVIPYIIQVVTPAKRPALPTDHEYEWTPSGVNIFLTDIDANVQVKIKRLTKFVSDIGVESLSIGIITKLVNAGYDTIHDLLSITKEDLMEIEGFGRVLAAKIYNNLSDALSEIDILVLMSASNIFGRGFGSRKLQAILENYPNIVLDYTPKKRTAYYKKLNALNGFDEITINKFLNALPTFIKFYHEVSDVIDVAEYESNIDADGIFSDQTVVFTGFREAQWEIYVQQQGGRVSSSVSKNTSLVVYMTGQESNAKYKKAVSLGVKTMTREAFSKKYKLQISH